MTTMFHPRIIFIFILVAKSLSHARPVKEVTVSVVTTNKVSAMEEVGGFNLQKEAVANFEASVRKLSKSKKVSSESVVASHGKRESGEGLEWEDSFKVFSSDYHPPKPHPPKNN